MLADCRSLCSRTCGCGAVALHVSDHSHGIKEEDQEIIFAPFFSTKRGGTDLGLAIVKKIVDAQGGNVSFCPNPERGVTFVVRLPFKHG